MAGMAGREPRHGKRAMDRLPQGRPDEAGISLQQALDEALCFGWIDGLRRGGHATWSIRFAPRRPDSVWSAVNMARIEELMRRAAGNVRGPFRLSRAAIPRIARPTPTRTVTRC